ncbi:PAS fold-containing protein [Tistlia consotensis]|uniref:histidine kinase n=1 Tax=Tistlia consotensis USBA 355 TaxID=560819 RepID=A0A1Y6BC01_9PROT|nr:response regulator [Tistlia consotensis]SME97001.1 PAS fold-containing protein [Tistlia consotensis USBA 355]SNR56420.1 PAS fold-containing protein [Tistlia consotensis]
MEVRSTEGLDAPDIGAPGADAASAALDALHEGVLVCDMLGRVTYLNPALRDLLGAARGEQAIGRHWGPLFTEDSRRRIERDGLPSILHGGHWQGRVELRGAEGAARACVLSLSAARRGGLVGLLRPAEAGTGGGPDTLSRSEARSERMEALRRLAGDMAHDLNNVLTSIVGYARFLTEDLPKDGQPHGFAEQIVVATQRAKQMVDEALAFARPGRGERKAVPVAATVERSVAQLRADLPAGTTLRLNAGPGELAVEAEPAAFAAVVGHVLKNAAEALEGRPGTIEVGWRVTGDLRQLPGLGKPGEPVKVTIEPAEGGRLQASAGAPDPNRRFVELVVHDSGAGIAPAVMEHVFEPFFTTRQPSKGRGLGLAAVYGQIIGHGGAILLDSAPGGGTTVKLFWPSAPVVDAKATARPGRRQLPRGQGQRILVAEDDRVLREALGEMLQRLGYRPTLVNDGEVARRVLAEGSAVEAVLTDRRMPNLSGTDLIDWMRAEGMRQPVLLCTGYGEDLNPAQLTRASGVAVLSKPVDAATLATSLDQLLSGPPD